MKNLYAFILIFTSVFLSFCNENEDENTENNVTKTVFVNKENLDSAAAETDTVFKEQKTGKELNIADYFILLKKSKLIDVPCDLSKENGNWKCRGEKDEAGFVKECQTLVDIKNGYIKIEDEGTGAGILVTETALFKTSDKRNIIAVNTYFADDILQNSSNPPKFYEFQNGNFKLLKDIFPETSPNDFLRVPVDLKKEFFGTYFELPHYGTTIKYLLDTNYAEKREDAFRENIKQTEFLYQFDKNRVKFFLK